MGAVTLWLRWEARSRWRSWLAIALVVGIGVGAVLTAVAGARRTSSAYTRFADDHRSWDVSLFFDPWVDGHCPASRPVDEFTLARSRAVASSCFDEVSRMPGVEEVAPIAVFFASGETDRGQRFESDPEVATSPIFVAGDEQLGATVNRPKLLAGRLAHPDHADEVVVGPAVAERLGLKPGTVLTVRFQRGVEGREISAPLRLHIVGVAVAPGEVRGASGGYLPILHLTPAFDRAHLADFSAFPGAFVRLRPGVEPEALAAEITDRQLPVRLSDQARDEYDRLIDQTTDVEAVNLWVLAALGGLAVVAVLGQTLARQARLEADGFEVLAAMGMSPRRRWSLGLLRTALVAVAGAPVAIAVAMVLSPLTPVGLAREVEPSPGVAFDPLVMGWGSVAAAALLVLVAAPAAWQAAFRGQPGDPRRSRLITALQRTGLPPTASTGTTLALDSGRGRRAGPVRSTLLSVTLGIATLVAALSFGASLNRLIDSPQLAGWAWDAAVFPQIDVPPERVLGDERLAAVTVASGVNARIGESAIPVVAFEPLRGEVGLPVIAGRHPTAADETALATETLSELGLGIGDRVELRAEVEVDDEPTEFELTATIVGRVALPVLRLSETGDRGDYAGLGRGAMLTPGGLRRLAPDVAAGAYFIRFRDGVDHEAALANLRRDAGDVDEWRRWAEPDALDAERLRNLPSALGALMGLFAVATLAYTLATTVRRGRRDFAVLKTMGFVRSQVRATVAWQASTLLSGALLTGLMLGVASGRWAWNVYADQLGVVSRPVIPMLVVAAAVPLGGLLLVILVAFPAGRAAARLRPAEVLRAE